MNEVLVHAPATVSNVVCGFDCLGFALSKPYDEVRVRKIDAPEIRIVHHDAYGLPTDPAKNVAGVALKALMDAGEIGHGFEVEITKNIKPGSGIGSSSASSCGAVVAANHLLGGRFTKTQLAEFAMEGEKLASGARHADNVAPTIFGGFVLVRSADPLDVVKIEHPELFVTVIHPQIEIRTADARAILPRDVPLKDAVKQWSNLGSLVAALSQKDIALMSRSMEDAIVEPVRKSLIPGFDDVKEAALSAGALGGGISGSGPSMFMLSESEETAHDIEKAMHDAYTKTGIDFNVHVSGIEPLGVRVVDI